ncbi:hypothetical protein H7U37_02170 [Pseudoflavonifractor phocaeensis]|uniref:LPO_1073/Vpar_1526 family protein n=1 Tax=Pseudoflavonifractor phocaeensis TaxID=1870988 RepID=UPI00195930E8|nr:LPO_1073/Vpar_1526 family protein [Pseudoflavonifractor phocaeensis]MBM6937333.1 hypothetical protein [Pseudoflavonifractor phocaeensis]
MSDNNILVEQKAAMGSHTTQIATQNNYHGLTPKEACDLAMQMFHDNFPKLQEAAREIAEERVSELMSKIADKMGEKQLTDMTPFGDPDVQYVMYEAQKNYARFGTQDMLSNLSELIVNRVQYNHEKICLKVAIDKAIEIVPMLTAEQLDTLSLLFLFSRTKNTKIHNLDELKRFLDEISVVFKKADLSSFSYLNMLGCLELYLYDPVEKCAESYNFKEKDVKKICPEIIKQTAGDYSTSYIGTILAIVNAELKLNKKFDPSFWIY